jgi:hypothetical protein
MTFKDLPFPVYGDLSFRGKCPLESQEQVSFFNKIRHVHPETWGKIAVHVKNEGLVRGGQFSAMQKHRAMGMVPGAPDIFIPGGQTLLIEMKRQDHTKSKLATEQIEYLAMAQDAGAFVCVALGAHAAWMAFEDWLGD